ncbi:MAG: hypothetical protein ACXWRU_16525 [Pseudobdellovibrionaceae bacterium]
MKKIILILCIITVRSWANEKTMDLEQLKSRLQLKVESFVTNTEGTQILDVGASKSVYYNKDAIKTGTYKGQFKDLQPANLAFKFTIEDNKELKLDITEYGRMEYDLKSRETKYSDERRRQSFIIKDFGSVAWVTKGSADKNIVVRFLPQFSEDDPKKLTYTPLAFSDAVMTDNAGRVWIEGSGAAGEVSGFITPYGTLYLSFIEFQGSKELGTAKDEAITLQLNDKMTVRLRSSKPVIGPGYVAKVYGIYFPERKGPTTVTSMTAETLEKQLKGIKK